MALITTLPEIKEVLPKLVSNLNSDSLMPNFVAVEQKYLLPLIGVALYNDLQAKYNANTLSVDELALVKHIRLVTASYGLYDEQAASHVFFTDEGIRVANTGDMVKAVGWEYKELRRYLYDRALDGTEVLLNYLYSRKADYPLWTASTAYGQFQSLLMRTGSEFSEQYTLYQPNRTFFSMKGVVEDAQEDYLVSAIGRSLVNYYLALDAPAGDDIMIVKRLKKSLAFYSIARACEHKPVRFSENGFTLVATAEDTETADMGRSPSAMQVLFRMKMDACLRDGKTAMAKAKNMLIAWRSNAACSVEFQTAYDASPLKDLTGTITRNRNNDKHHHFRF
jgi:hypothetical protein